MIKFTIMVPVYNQEKLIIRALDSIPKRNDIEILIIDDNSSDNTYKNINDWVTVNKNLFGSITLKKNDHNMGCGFGKNWAYSTAKGDYITTLDSDDYLYTQTFNLVLDKLYETESDMIFISNRVNNGSIWSDSTRKATWSYFIRRDFLFNSGLNYRASARRAGDYELTKALQSLNHTEENWKYVTYHYNYPREGSIVWNWDHYRRV